MDGQCERLGELEKRVARIEKEHSVLLKNIMGVNSPEEFTQKLIANMVEAAMKEVRAAFEKLNKKG